MRRAAKRREISRTRPGRSRTQQRPRHRAHGRRRRAVALLDHDAQVDGLERAQCLLEAGNRSAGTSTRSTPANLPARCAMRLSSQFPSCAATAAATASTSRPVRADECDYEVQACASPSSETRIIAMPAQARSRARRASASPPDGCSPRGGSRVDSGPAGERQLQSVERRS